MKQITILFFLAFSLNFAYSQKSEFIIPDYELIKSEIKDSASKFYYPNFITQIFYQD